MSQQPDPWESWQGLPAPPPQDEQPTQHSPAPGTPMQNPNAPTLSKAGTLPSRRTTDKNKPFRPRLRSLSEIWKTWQWSGLALCYGLCCVFATVWAAWGEPKMIRVSFGVLGFLFFCLGFAQFFYPLASLPFSQQKQEQRLLFQPPRSWWTILLRGCLGLLCVGLLLAFLWLRAGTLNFQ